MDRIRPATLERRLACHVKSGQWNEEKSAANGASQTLVEQIKSSRRVDSSREDLDPANVAPFE